MFPEPSSILPVTPWINYQFRFVRLQKFYIIVYLTHLYFSRFLPYYTFEDARFWLDFFELHNV